MAARENLKVGQTIWYRHPEDPTDGTWRKARITKLLKKVALVTYTPDGGGFIPDLNMSYDRIFTEPPR
jgi:hypothetical protein